MMLDAIPMDVSEEKETEQQILVSMTYSSLRKRNILSGFGAVDVTPEALPLDSKDVDVAGGFTSTKVLAY
jgi:glycine betaine/choline ABC-type transport system substrate-binding protein